MKMCSVQRSNDDEDTRDIEVELNEESLQCNVEADDSSNVDEDGSEDGDAGLDVLEIVTNERLLGKKRRKDEQG